MADDPLKAEKAVAYYAALVDAWVDTRMEKDRTLLALSAGGIGLLATLLTTVGPSSPWELWLYAGAGAAFMVSVFTAILVFNQNSRHLKDVIHHGREGDDPKLVMLDRVLFWSFVAGVGLTVALAAASGYGRMQERNAMNDRNQQDFRTTNTTVPGQRSLTGIGDLAPGDKTPTPSLTGIGDLKPATGSGTTSQGTGATSTGSGEGTKK